MMTDIHAKPLRSSASANDTVRNRMEGGANPSSAAKGSSSDSTEGSISHTATETGGKKKTADKSVGALEKKKKDKKKALKRL